MLGIFLAASTSVSLLSLSHHFPVVEQCVYSQLVPRLVSSDKNPKYEVLNVTEGSHLTGWWDGLPFREAGPLHTSSLRSKCNWAPCILFTQSGNSLLGQSVLVSPGF